MRDAMRGRVQTIILAELERLFDAGQLQALALTHFGLKLERAGKAALAAELVQRCASSAALDALSDVIVLLRPGADSRIEDLRQRGLLMPEALKPESTLGRYRLERALGAGDVSSVFTATDESTPLRVKVLKASLRDRAAIERYFARSRAVAALAERGAAPLRQAGEIGDRFAVVHELVPGRVLSELFTAEQAQSLRSLASVLQGLLEALDALHRRGLVHGDLRASNVLVTEDQGVVLLDAGAYFVRHPLDALAPEQLSGELPTPRSDVYAFGCLLYQLVSGKPVFAGSRAQVVEGRLTRTPEPASFAAPRAGIIAELDELLLDLLDRAPAQRPADAEAVRDRLDSLLALRRSEPAPAPVSDDQLQAQIDQLRARPEDEELAAVLESQIDQGADPVRIARAYLAIADGLPARSRARRPLRRRAALLFESSADDAHAEQVYRALLTGDPSDQEAWTALERLARRAGDYEKVVELGLERIEHISDGAARARAIAAIGDVLRTKLADAEQAQEAYLRAFCEDPSPAYAAQVEALAAGRQAVWTEVLSTLADAAAQELSVEKRTSLLLQLGRWYAVQAVRADLALQCFEAVLLGDPNQEDALSAAAELLEQQPGGADRAALLYERLIALKPSYSAAHEALAHIYEHVDPYEYDRVLARWADAAGGDQWCELTLRRAELQESLHEDDEARALYEAVLERQPREARALAGQDRLLSRSNRPLELRSLLEREIDAAQTPQQKIRSLERLAALLASEFHDIEAAAATLEKVVALQASQLGALNELGVYYTKLERWELLGQTYARLIAAMPIDDERVAMQLGYARLLERRLHQPELALASYEAVLAIDRRQIEALTAVARLYAENGAIGHAVEALDALAALDPFPEAHVQHLTRAAELLVGQNDLPAAIERLRRAFAAQPDAADVAARLRSAYLAQGDVDAAIELLEQQVARAKDADLRADLALELGKLFTRKGEHGRARAAAELALKAKPNDPAAHIVLGDAARNGGEAERATLHYAAAVERLQSLPREQAGRLLADYAQVLFDSNQAQKALARMDELVQKFSEDAQAMLRASEVLLEHGAPERVVVVCRDVLARFGDSLDEAQQSLLLYRLGEALRRTGQLDEAIEALERSAHTDPLSSAPLAALRAAFATQERWVDVSRTLVRQLERAAPAERAELLVEIGDLAATTLKDSATAAASYLAALRLKGQDRKILLKLMQVYTAERDFAKVLAAILELADATPKSEDRAKHLLVAARVALTELADQKQALELTTRALELAPESDAIAREALVLRREAGDSDGARHLLERRVEAAAQANDRALAINLAAELADEYLADLQGDEAIAVNEAVLRLTGTDPVREEVLSDLYESEPVRYRDRALSLVERAVARDPSRPEPYRRLVRLYRAMKEPDGLFCVSQALVALDLADELEQKWFDEQRASGEVGGPAISDDDWQELVVHPSVDRTLTRIFALLEPVLRHERAVSLERLGYAASSRIDVGVDAPLVRALVRSAALIGAPVPDLFADPQLAAGLRMPPSARPSFVLSESARGAHVPLRQAAFVAGAHVCLTKPGFYVRVLVPRIPALKAWLLAAVRLLVPKLEFSAELETLTAEAHGHLQHGLAGAARDELTQLIAELLRSDQVLDVGAWAAGVDLTSDRLGLVAAGDLPTALAVVRATGESASAVAASERERQLLAYSVSLRYLALRAKYGLGVGAPKGNARSGAAAQ